MTISLKPRRCPAWRRLAAGLLLFCGAAWPLQAEEQFTLNLENSDIAALIATVSEITGRNFVIDPRVKGKVSVVSSRPMGREQVYQVFLSILQVHGFSAVTSGEIVKIVPDVNAKQIGARPPEEGSGDESVTRVVQLQNVSAAQLVPILRPLVPQEGHLAAYPGGNALIISDRAANINRLVEILRRVDQSSDSETEVIRLRHGSAAEVVRVLTALEQRPQQQADLLSPRPVLVADERTNSVLMTGERGDRLRLRTLIAHLDTPLESTGNTHVIYLRYARAKDLATVLTGVGERLDADTKAAAAARGAAGAGGGQSPISIQAEESSNALVITAPLAVLESLRSVIRQLDIRRAQVLVEAIIAEVSPSRSAELGIQWRTEPQPGTGGFASFGSFANTAGTPTVPFDISNLGGGLTLGYFSGGSLRALLRALASDTSTNVLSTPTLVTLDNEEAEIVVGENVPFVTGQYASSTVGTGVNPFTTIERQDVGVKLKVKPQINEGSSVRLDIKQEVSSVIEESIARDADAANLRTRKRSIETKVLVDDGEVLVLGGLIEDALNRTESKVPLLGDIPVLGLAFRSQTLRSEKKNLMVFLRPTILRDARDGALVSRSKYSHIRSEQERLQDPSQWLLRESAQPLLQDFSAPAALPAAAEPPLAAAPAAPPAPAPEPAPERRGFVLPTDRFYEPF